MLSKLRSRLSYANVMATVAVFIALGGGSYAAIKLPANSVGNKQLKKNAVTLKKIRQAPALPSRDRRATPVHAERPGRQARRVRRVRAA